MESVTVPVETVAAGIFLLAFFALLSFVFIVSALRSWTRELELKRRLLHEERLHEERLRSDGPVSDVDRVSQEVTRVFKRFAYEVEGIDFDTNEFFDCYRWKVKKPGRHRNA